MMETIELKDAMKLANMGNPFSMRVVSFDEKRNTAGDVIQYSGVTTTPKFKRKKTTSLPSTTSRKANHFSNDTQNIILPDGKTVSFHPRLMIEFEGKEVVY